MLNMPLPACVYTLRCELVTVDSRLGEVEEPDGSLSHAGWIEVRMKVIREPVKFYGNTNHSKLTFDGSPVLVLEMSLEWHTPIDIDSVVESQTRLMLVVKVTKERERE